MEDRKSSSAVGADLLDWVELLLSRHDQSPYAHTCFFRNIRLIPFLLKMDYGVSNPLGVVFAKKISAPPPPPLLVSVPSNSQEGFVIPLLYTNSANSEVLNDLVLKKHFFSYYPPVFLFSSCHNLFFLGYLIFTSPGHTSSRVDTAVETADPCVGAKKGGRGYIGSTDEGSITWSCALIFKSTLYFLCSFRQLRGYMQYSTLPRLETPIVIFPARVICSSSFFRVPLSHLQLLYA